MTWNENLDGGGVLFVLRMHLSASLWGIDECEIQMLASLLTFGRAFGSTVACIEASRNGISSQKPTAQKRAKGSSTSEKADWS